MHGWLFSYLADITLLKVRFSRDAMNHYLQSAHRINQISDISLAIRVLTHMIVDTRRKKNLNMTDFTLFLDQDIPTTHIRKISCPS